MRELKINPELESHLPGVPAETDDQLERSLLKQGKSKDSIVIWKETGEIVDGHRRYKICRKHGLPYEVEEMSFADISEAKYWMDTFQTARRSLSEHDYRMVRARMLTHERRTSEPDAVGRVAEKTGVSRRTVFRDSLYAKAYESLTKPVQSYVSKQSASYADVLALSKLPQYAQENLIKEVEEGEYLSLGDALHDTGGAEEDEADEDESPAGAEPPEDEPPFFPEYEEEESPPKPAARTTPRASAGSSKAAADDWRLQRSAAIKYAEATMRAVGDLYGVRKNEVQHHAAMGAIATLITELKKWN